MVSKTPFPIEVLDHIFSSGISPHDLSYLLRVNSVFHSVAVRVLYYRIDLYVPHRAFKGLANHISCLKTLCQVSKLASLVRVLFVGWILLPSAPTRNLYRLLNQALRCLGGLTSLRICLAWENITTYTSFNYIFDACSFSLTQFTFTGIYHPSVNSFLKTQSKISSLNLMTAIRCNIDLDPLSLPHLNHLEVGEMEWSMLTLLIGRRPVKSVRYIPFTKGTQFNALRLSTGPIQSMTTLLRDSNLPFNNFLGEVVDALPCLSTLYMSTMFIHPEVGRIYYQIVDLI
jgi:hypothetical protein